MSDILDDYRKWQARRQERVLADYTHHWVDMYVDECMINMLAAEVERLRNGAPAACETVAPTLTNAEQEAVKWAIAVTARTYDDAEGGPQQREALRGLLARLGGGA